MYSRDFTPEVWNRYLSLTGNLEAIMTRNSMMFAPDQLNSSLNKIDGSKIVIHLIPHNKDSFKHFFSYKIKKQRDTILEEQIKNADAVIIRSPNSKLVNLCKKYGKPYAVEVVGCVWDSLWNHSIKGKFFALPCFIDLKRVVKNAPYVLYVTNDFLQKRYPSKGHSIACSNVLLNDIDEVHLINRKEKIKNHSGKLIIGTAAALNVKYKGQKYVIRALAKLKKQGIKDYEYQLAGGGDAMTLLNEAKRLGVDNMVNVIGQLPHEQIFSWLENIDIYIQPSLQEGLPRAVIEAMSYGLPCIGFRTAGIPELLKDEMICKRRSSYEISEKLKSLDCEKMLELSEYSFKKAKEYDRNFLNKRRNDFYNKFIESAKGS